MNQQVHKKEFQAFIRNHPELTGKPIEGYKIAAMQYVDKDNKVHASCKYEKAGKKVNATFFINR